MGQTLSRKPISQRNSFPTLTTGSSPFAVDQAQYQGYTTPTPPQSATNTMAGPDPGYQAGGAQMMSGLYEPPSVLGAGFQRFGRLQGTDVGGAGVFRPWMTNG